MPRALEILFLCHRIPFPPNKGEKIRAHAVLSHLASRHVVHLGCFVDDPADMEHAPALQSLVSGECALFPLNKNALYGRALHALVRGEPITTSYFGDQRLSNWVAHILNARPIHCAYLFGSAMAPYLFDRPEFDPARVVLDMVDIDSDKWLQYAQNAKIPLKWVYRREAKTLFELERRSAQQFGATVFVSPFEAQSFVAMAPEVSGRVYSVANGVDCGRFSPTLDFPNPFPSGCVPIVMTGAMDYRPNVDGAIWFSRSIMPLIRREVPNAHFFAVGANPADGLRAEQGESVTVSGWVADVRPYIAHARAVVAPLRMARGVQNKVLEAMAMEKPVVATNAASRALSVQPGNHLWVEDDPVAFAHAVREAVSGAARAEVARNGRRYVELAHDWSRNLADLDVLLERATGAGSGHILEPEPRVTIDHASISPRTGVMAGGI